jgi:hypothetical protein
MQNTLHETIDDALLLIEQNFYFLHAGEFFALWSRREDLSVAVPGKLVKVFEGGLPYTFDGGLIRTVLSHEYAAAEGDASLFEYFVEFNAFRGIAMGMIEATQNPSPFRDFLRERLGKERFENLIDIVAFVRTGLTHNTHAEIHLTPKDYEGRRKRIERMGRDTEVKFDFHYYDDLPEISAPSEEYGLHLSVDFGTLTPATPFLEILSMGDLMLLSELCFNWVMVYRIATEKN